MALEPEDLHLALDAGVGVMEPVVGQGSTVFSSEANRPHVSSSRRGSRSYPPAVYARIRSPAICATFGRAEYSYQSTDWALEHQFVTAVQHNPEVGVIDIENARLDRRAGVIQSGF